VPHVFAVFNHLVTDRSMLSIFSKPCHVVGRPVFDHFPWNEIDTYFSANPPHEFLKMCRTFGRGTLCQIFEFTRIFNVIALDSWTSIHSEEGRDAEVCELIGTHLRLSIGYGVSGRYYILDFDNNTFQTSFNLEKALEAAADYRQERGVAQFPFFITATASRQSYYVELGDYFFERACEAKIPSLSIRYYFHYHGTYTLLFDKDDYFIAIILTGESVSAEGQSLLTFFINEECDVFDPQYVFRLLNQISDGKLRIVRREF
jgi:hypothetical protein